jgi:hypothetical protein
MNNTPPILCPNLYVNKFGEFCYDKEAYGGYVVRRIITTVHQTAGLSDFFETAWRDMHLTPDEVEFIFEFK